MANGGSKKFDMLTALGIILGIGFVIFGIIYNDPPKNPGPEATQEQMDAYNQARQEYVAVDFNVIPNQFWNIPSVSITIGGTIAALMMSFPLTAFAAIPKHLSICFNPTKYDTQKYITQIAEFAKEARMKGLLSLEDKLNESRDAFLKNSLMLVVDSVEPEKVHNLLEAELEHLDERHAIARGLYDRGATFAPAFGMIGTLIGLIKMLANMQDANTIGPAMAVALLTTLYGSLIANLFFTPISSKLRARHEEEYLCKVLICEGVESIQAGENPKFIEEKLQMLVLQSNEKKRRKEQL